MRGIDKWPLVVAVSASDTFAVISGISSRLRRELWETTTHIRELRAAVYRNIVFKINSDRSE